MDLPPPTLPIAAIATAPGRGAVGIVRVSGPDLQAVVQAICGRSLRPREATYLSFQDARGEAIDLGLAIHFPAPHSYTGEDVLELQAHGGPVVLQLLLARCLEVGQPLGMRVARPGEFTERAFLNDKLDLAQAEAVADLIDASTEAAARGASRSLSGAFSAEITKLSDALVEMRMLVEASLDFPEEDIDILQRADIEGRLARLRQSVQATRAKAGQGALLREGIKVVLAGQPNAGKSSLLNALAGAELAIVTPIAGTTRDKVQQTIQIEGVPVHIVDTAGLRDSQDEIERLGMQRTWAEIGSADAVLFLHDLSQLEPSERAAARPLDARHYNAGEVAIAQTLRERMPAGVPVIDVWNKADVLDAPLVLPERLALQLSARTGDGLQGLRETLLTLAGWQPAAEGIYMARERHLQALARVMHQLDAAQACLAQPAPPLDLLAEELRLAHNALSEITGAFGADDLLGVIFSRFCIGK